MDKLGYQIIDILEMEVLENNFDLAESRPTYGLSKAIYQLQISHITCCFPLFLLLFFFVVLNTFAKNFLNNFED